MHINCPHCQNPIEIVGEQPAGILCPSCGSSIMLDPGKTRTFLPTGTPRRLTFCRAAELIAEVADALHVAHEHGVIHRDIKASNIMIDLDDLLASDLDVLSRPG